MRTIRSMLHAAAAVAVFAISAGTAEAGKTVWCQFQWQENDDLNVQAGHTEAMSKSVRTKEFNRLVEQERVRVRVSADRGEHCILNHPENTRIDARIEKADVVLDSVDRLPYCRDLDATAICVGSRRGLPHP